MFNAKYSRSFLSLYINRLNNDGSSSVSTAAWHFFWLLPGFNLFLRMDDAGQTKH